MGHFTDSRANLYSPRSNHRENDRKTAKMTRAAFVCVCVQYQCVRVRAVPVCVCVQYQCVSGLSVQQGTAPLLMWYVRVLNMQ